MIKGILKFCLIVTSVILFDSCFEEDTPMDPVDTSKEIKINTSIYNNQIFFQLSDTSTITNTNSAWDLAFENGKDGWHIKINYANYIGILNTTSHDFTATSYVTSGKSWLYDASSGNADSTAIGDWQNPVTGSPEVYLWGIYDGVNYTPSLKIKFLAVTDTSYSFTYANLDNTNLQEVTLPKNENCNYTYYKLSNHKTVDIEPVKNNWDLEFTQYMTTLYTDAGIPTPYLVRGVYLNPNKVAVLLDSITGYDNITLDQVDDAKLSHVQDYIGYNWKSVTINEATNSASYTVRKNYTYIVKDTKGDYYKFKFTSFVNDELLVGYPSFKMALLE